MTLPAICIIAAVALLVGWFWAQLRAKRDLDRGWISVMGRTYYVKPRDEGE